MEARRNQRVAESLREELTELIGLELVDPRLDGVTVTEIHLSPDSRVASVRLAIPGDMDRQKQALAAIDGAKGFIKKQLAARLDIFRVPDLRFEADLAPTVSDRVPYLMRKIRKGRPRDPEATEKAEKKPKA